jgi:hypothetical protein
MREEEKKGLPLSLKGKIKFLEEFLSSTRRAMVKVHGIEDEKPKMRMWLGYMV